MKWVAVLSAPTVGVLAALETLLDTVAVTTTTAVDTANLELLAQSTNALATGVVTSFAALLGMVFLINAAVTLTLHGYG